MNHIPLIDDLLLHCPFCDLELKQISGGSNSCEVSRTNNSFANHKFAHRPAAYLFYRTNEKNNMQLAFSYEVHLMMKQFPLMTVHRLTIFGRQYLFEGEVNLTSFDSFVIWVNDFQENLVLL